jgi:hypothetical protein
MIPPLNRIGTPSAHYAQAAFAKVFYGFILPYFRDLMQTLCLSLSASADF